MKQQKTVQNFEVILEPEEGGGYHVSCPLLKGCHSCGISQEEALQNIEEAIELWLESAKEMGIDLPKRGAC